MDTPSTSHWVGSMTTSHVHNCIHCLPCVQVTLGWLVGLSLQKRGWSYSMKGSGVKIWQSLITSSLSLRLAGVSDWPLSGDGG